MGLYRDADTQVESVEDDTLVLMPSITFMPDDDTTLTLIALHQDTDSDTVHSLSRQKAHYFLWLTDHLSIKMSTQVSRDTTSLILNKHSLFCWQSMCLTTT